MAKVKDVVCGMTVDTEAAPAKTEYEGETYYFCALSCKAAFEENPEQYLQARHEEHRGHQAHGGHHKHHCC